MREHHERMMQTEHNTYKVSSALFIRTGAFFRSLPIVAGLGRGDEASEASSPEDLLNKLESSDSEDDIVPTAMIFSDLLIHVEYNSTFTCNRLRSDFDGRIDFLNLNFNS